MPTIVREDIDQLNVIIKVDFPKSEYQPTVEKELKKLQKRVVIKGFRAGTAPMPLVKKMYSKSVLVESVVDTLQTEVNKYIYDNKLPTLGKPVPVEDNFSPDTANQDFWFKYQVGLVPPFEIEGTDKSSKIVRDEIIITNEIIDKEVEQLRRRYGKWSDVDTLQREGMFKARLVEFENGEPKADGLVVEEAFIALKDAREAFLDLVEGKNVGDIVLIEDIFAINEETNERVKSYILGVKENAEVGATYEATIVSARGVFPAELGEEFYNQLFDEEVKTEEEFREKLREVIANEFSHAANLRVYRRTYKMLMEKNQFDLPLDYIKKQILFDNPKAATEAIDAELPAIQAQVRWSLLKGRLARTAEAQVTEEEIRQSLRKEIYNYYGMYANPQLVEMTLRDVMKKEDTVEKRYQELLDNKVLAFVAENITLESNFMSLDDFNETAKTFDQE